jgi:hypothetical protein
MFRGRLSIVVFASSLSAGLIAGCSGVDSSVQEESSGATLAPAEAEAVCVASFKRQRECGDTFLPALVDLRVRLDKPAGIAEADRTEGRAALLATAQEEWRNDSTDEAIASTCSNMVTRGRGAAMAGPMKSCLAASACAEFVPCQIDLMEAKLRN